jgi:hypothetical protein
MNKDSVCDLLAKIFGTPVSIPTDINNTQYNLSDTTHDENICIGNKNYIITGAKCNNCHKLVSGNVYLSKILEDSSAR